VRDWYLEALDRQAQRGLRHEIRSYLERHGEAGADFDGAELVAAELIENGVSHAGGSVWVSLEWSQIHPVLTVADLGAGFDLHTELPADSLTSEGGRGLFIVSRIVKELKAVRRRSGGTVVQATLPIARAASPSFDRPRRTVGVLPSLDEAGPEGGFGKESFLRALVVQLAQAVELEGGPHAAEAAITQVGTDVGGQMETEYRQTKEIVDRLSPDQMADCFVRLKHAIDGQFQVIEANAERIVLVNDACPFGPVVRHAPALCRMTSSVFGGIAARNSSDGASVILEERIALGDPQCHVVIELDATVDTKAPWAHRYRPPRD
jgi:anti-sigma regulatory factor (Ser/Thr protein kinase)